MNNFSINDLTQYESQTMLCGDLIGVGSTRQVYFFQFDKTKVVKVAKDFNSILANQSEFQTYSSIMGDPEKQKYFAKIHLMSPLGSLLIQDFYPLVYPGTYLIPKYLTDLKRENFGFDTKTNSVVCIDYHLNLLNSSSSKLVKVKF